MKSLDAIREYGRAEGRLEVRRQIALALIQDGLYTFDDITRICSLAATLHR